VAKTNFCTAKCRHLRSFRYGFDNSKIIVAYNGKDHLAGCALRPDITIHLRAMPVCAATKGAEQ